MVDDPNDSKDIKVETQEIEIVEFYINDEYFGIDVTQVREIIRATEGVVPLPEAHPSISGVINLRGVIIPVIHLAKHLSIDADYNKAKNRIIVSEYNEMQIGFWVSNVTRLHRVEQSDIDLPKGLVATKSGYSKGIVEIDGRLLFLLDFQKIIKDINPEINFYNNLQDRKIES